MTSSACRCRWGRSTRSASELRTHSMTRTSGSPLRSWVRRPSTSMRPAGAPPARAGPSGRRPRRRGDLPGRRGRHRDRLEELIGGSEGIVCSDRWWAYDHLDPKLRQACWQHLWRDFTRHSEGLAEQKAIGQAGLELTKRLFSAWHAFGEHGDRDRLKREMEPVEAELRSLCERAGRKSKRTRYHGRFARNLLKIWPALWTFVRVPASSPPTTRPSAPCAAGDPPQALLRHPLRRGRALRRAGAVGLGHMPVQGRSLFAYLTELLTARSRGSRCLCSPSRPKTEIRPVAGKTCEASEKEV